MATDFQKSVWQALTKIPKGKVTTYRLLAEYIGKPKAVRAVGTAVGKNPDAPHVPCHRVVQSDGRVGQYSAGEGTQTKVEILKREGVMIKGDTVVDFKKVRYVLR